MNTLPDTSGLRTPYLQGPIPKQPDWDEVFLRIYQEPMRELGTVTTDPALVGDFDYYLWEGPDLGGKGRYCIPHLQRTERVPDGWRAYCDREDLDLATEKGRAEFASRHRDWAAGLASASSAYTTTVYTEIDDGDLDEQVGNIQRLVSKTGLIPTMVIHSGGKSLHVHYLLDAPLPVDDPRRLRVHDLLAVALAGDQSVRSTNRKMRRPAWTGRRKQPLWLWQPEQAVFIEDLLAKLLDYVSDELGIEGDEAISLALRDLADSHQLDLHAGRINEAHKLDDEARIEKRRRASQKAREAASELRRARGSSEAATAAVRATVGRLLSITGARKSRSGLKTGRKLGTTRSGRDLSEVPASEWPSLMPGRQECPWCVSVASSSAPPLLVSTDLTRATCYRMDCNATYVRIDDSDDFLKRNPEITLLGMVLGDVEEEEPEEVLLTVEDVLASITPGPEIRDAGELLEAAVLRRARRIDEAILAQVAIEESSVDVNPGSESQNAECPPESIYYKKEDLYRFRGTNGDSASESMISVRWNCTTALTSVKSKPGEAVQAQGLRCLSKTCPTCSPLMAICWEAALEAGLLADFGHLTAMLVLGPVTKVNVTKRTLKRWTSPLEGGARNHWVEMRLTKDITVSLFLFERFPTGKLGKGLKKHGIEADLASIMQLVRIDPSTAWRGGSRFRWITASEALLNYIEHLHALLIRRRRNTSENKARRKKKAEEKKEKTKKTKKINLVTSMPVAGVVKAIKEVEDSIQVEGRLTGSTEVQWAEIHGEGAHHALGTAVDLGMIPESKPTRRRKVSELEAIWTDEMSQVEFTFDDFLV